jgi:hypothetical protein
MTVYYAVWAMRDHGGRLVDCGVVNRDDKTASRSIRIVARQGVERLLETEQVCTAKWDPVSGDFDVTGRATWDTLQGLPRFFTLDIESDSRIEPKD